MEASNLQELKDAAIELMKFTCNSCEQRFCEDDIEEEDGQRVPSPCSAIIRMRNALSANPIRNCDIGSPDEQEKRFKEFCDAHWSINNVDSECAGCPLTIDGAECEFTWAQMPYKSQNGKD